MMLPAYGWSVVTARDGFEAILCFRAGACGVLPPHDWLSGINGGDILNWVRCTVANRPEVAVVSSECRDFLQSRFWGVGVRAILPKRLSAHDLIGALPS